MDRKTILNIFGDAMANILYYDRKDDGNVGAIEDAIISGEISRDDILELIDDELYNSVKARKNEKN